MPRTDIEPIIEFRDVGKSYGALKAVDGVSFAVRPGETVSLLGPSGCGKTTTLRLAAGFEQPDRGRVLIGNRDMTGKRPYERNVGILFQNYALFPHMSVADNVAYGLKQRRWPRQDIAARVDEMLQLVQLDGLHRRQPHQLSGGQQQRVALARTLATKPQLVLLDEPLSALDAKLREELRLELKRILTSVGSTTIVVTHDQAEAMSLADRLFVMNRGRIEQVGTPSAVYAQPVTRFVADFIGQANWLRAVLVAMEDDGIARLRTADAIAMRVAGISGALGSAWDLCLRPERIRLLIGEAPVAIVDNVITGQLQEYVHLGGLVQYVVRCGDHRILMVEPNRGQVAPSPGAVVRLAFGPRDCLVLPADDPAPAVALAPDPPPAPDGADIGQQTLLGMFR